MSACFSTLTMTLARNRGAGLGGKGIRHVVQKVENTGLSNSHRGHVMNPGPG
jgi:hypothetical protein